MTLFRLHEGAVHIYFEYKIVPRSSDSAHAVVSQAKLPMRRNEDARPRVAGVKYSPFQPCATTWRWIARSCENTINLHLRRHVDVCQGFYNSQ